MKLAVSKYRGTFHKALRAWRLQGECRKGIKSVGEIFAFKHAETVNKSPAKSFANW